MKTGWLQGLVVATHGRHCWIETDSGERRLCHPRGKRQSAVVGDRVWWQPSLDEGTIEQIEPRRNLLYRQDAVRTKSFAANLDQVLVLLAAEPVFSESQLNRALIAARAEGLPALVALNKSDLAEPFQQAWSRLQPYRDMGQRVWPLSLNREAGLSDLRAELEGKTTLVLGPSGVGKSTLVNRLVPDAAAATSEISRALNTGRHTTTSTTWYWIDRSHHTALIDSPGFQEFGLHHIPAPKLALLMPDFEPLAGQCRFHNCSHLHEPDCAVRAAVGHGITPQRYRLYAELYKELAAAPRY